MSTIRLQQICCVGAWGRGCLAKEEFALPGPGLRLRRDDLLLGKRRVSEHGRYLCCEEIEQGKPFVKSELIHADVVDYLRQSRSGSFDFISAFNFLEHLPKEAARDVLTESRRVLRPGGTLVW